MSEEKFGNTQVVVLDDMPVGPFYEMWGLLTSLPVLRKSDLLSMNEIEERTIILPLAGGANPFWEGDWHDLECSTSPLLDVFSARVLDFYKVRKTSSENYRPLVITFIGRREKRRLVGQSGHLQILRLKYPHLQIDCVEPASLRLRFSSYIGLEHRYFVHGAGLALAIFQRPGSAVVEILPHGLAHKGFRNLAKLRGSKYFGIHALESKPERLSKRDGDVMVGTHRVKHQDEEWQHKDVELSEKQFLELMEQAIESIQDRDGLLHKHRSW